MGMKINIPVGTKVMIKYQELDENLEGIICGKVTNIFNGLIDPNLDCDHEEVAGIFVEKWIENNKKIEIKRNVNDKTNIYRSDLVYKID